MNLFFFKSLNMNHKGPENINYTIVKNINYTRVKNINYTRVKNINYTRVNYGERLFGHHTPAVVKINGF